MYRNAARRLLTAFSSTTSTWRMRRALSTDAPAVAFDDSAFVQAWRQVAPNIEPPTTQLWLLPTPPPPSKITVNICLPCNSDMGNKEVDMVIIPEETGQMAVLPGHACARVKLRPGLLTVHKGNDVTKYFVYGGFASIQKNSFLRISTREAVPLEQIDPSLVQKGLNDFTQKLNSANTDFEKAEAQTGVDVHNALIAALTA